MVKIYDSMVFDMKTGEVLEHGDVSYIDESEITQLKGGGTQTSTSSTKTDPRLEQAAVDLLSAAKGKYQGGNLGEVAGASGLQNKLFGTATTPSAAGQAFDQARTDAGTIRTGVQDYKGSLADFNTQTASNAAANHAYGTGGLGGIRNVINQDQIKQAGQAQFAQQQATLLGQANQLEAGAINQLGQVGSAQRGITQEGLDTDVKALRNYGNAFGSAQGGFGTDQTSTSPKQGGK